MRWYALRFVRYFFSQYDATALTHTHTRMHMSKIHRMRIHLKSNNNSNEKKIENSALIVRTLKMMKLPPKKKHEEEEETANTFIRFHDKYFVHWILRNHSLALACPSTQPSVFASALVYFWCNHKCLCDVSKCEYTVVEKQAAATTTHIAFASASICVVCVYARNFISKWDLWVRKGIYVS